MPVELGAASAEAGSRLHAVTGEHVSVARAPGDVAATMTGTRARTLFDKVWDSHVVHRGAGEAELLYVDLHLVQEVSSPQAFAELRAQGRRVRRPDLTLATADHSVPTTDRLLPIADQQSRVQVETLRENCREFGVALYDVTSQRQGIVHVIGPELGLTQPGMTIVCGDSHTTTHGAFGALAMGIGTSEVAHVLATQCLTAHRPKTLEVAIDGVPGLGVTAKDIALGIIARRGAGAATGCAIQYTGSTVERLSMEARMTLCNMSIEAGARVGMIAPDQVTYDYLRGRPALRTGDVPFEELVEHWSAVAGDPGAVYDLRWSFRAEDFEPMVSWGTTPAMSVPVGGIVPLPADCPDPSGAERALAYMGLHGGERPSDLHLDRVFIGSCTNGRIEDLRAAAEVARGRQVAAGVQAMVVPGSTSVRLQAEREGLADVFLAAGFQWREAGCSMCVAMNGDVLASGQRCASTSNRNFEGRQGAGGRTHLVSPAMAAAAAVYGHFVDVRELAPSPHPPREREQA